MWTLYEDISKFRWFHFKRYGTVQLHPGTINVGGLVQDCSISSALAMEMLQSCTKLSYTKCQDYVSVKIEFQIAV